ncbi:MAG: hypothetical protein JXM71_12685, partial [Spirochaetales bacterium]|nr:hypothetical protein [Spirochaetales bacterium]
VASFLGNGPCIPVTGIKRTTAGYEARTPTGRFPVSPRDAQRAQKGEPVSVFFERTAALPASVNDSGSSGCFSASCLRADFAGDAIDCQMEAGDDHFVLRFPKDVAPLAGETRRYSVRTSAIKLVR